MDFFKSVFADDPDPPKPQPESESESDALKADYSTPDSPPKHSDPNPNSTGWSFGGLIKTITASSVIETYRRDLEEFGLGLKKEIEVAQGSLGNVSHVIDEFGNTVIKGTTQIINQGKEAILAADNESDSSSSESNKRNPITQRSLNSNRYSRFDAQVSAIQGDVNTYVEEPEDLGDYEKWKLGFDLGEKKEEMERLIQENGEMGSLYKRVVGVSNGVVDHETFWFRYFYKVFKLKQAEDMRVKLVKRAISREEEEELSWDVDEDEDEEEMDEGNSASLASLKKDVEKKEKDEIVEEKAEKDEIVEEKAEKDEIVEEKAEKVDLLENKDQVEKVEEINEIPVDGSNKERKGNDDDESREGKGNDVDDDESSGVNVVNEKVNVEEKNEEPKSIEKVASEGKGDNVEPSNGNGKDSDFAVVSSQPSMAEEEEDLGWDEIEDLSSIDDKKGTSGGSPSSSNRADIRKRLSTAEEDEDLSWDIEDDDEPVKA